MGATVTYNGSVIAELNGGEAKKLKTAGTYLEGDLTVEAAEVIDSPLPIEFSTEEEAAAIIESGEIGGVYKYIGETTETYENGALYALYNSYLNFRSPNSFTLNIVDNAKHWDGVLEYSTDYTTWNEWDGTTTISADNGLLYMRGTGNTVITGSHSSRWELTGSDIFCSGNIENLLDYTTVENGDHPTMADYCYSGMFSGCTSLTTAPNLPATTLADYCYAYMFQNCTSLASAPELSATILTSYCYDSMFSGCTSLTTAPNLPATTLTSHCYYEMFYDCSSLTKAPELPATTLAVCCYYLMFYGCTGLTTAPELPATTLANDCYRNMFRECTSLTTAPNLPATTLADSCYDCMFHDCTSLTTAPELPATTLAYLCYYSMFEGCTNIKLSAEQTDEYTIAYRIPTSGEGTIPEDATDALADMFTSTGGTFTGTPEINTTYYLHSSNKVV